MNKLKKAAAAAAAILIPFSVSRSAFAEDTQSAALNITVNPSKQIGKISPYIYGVNTGADLNAVSAGSIRLGGNRMSAYNWENNMSNAGSDYFNTSDMYLVTDIDEEFRRIPGGPVLSLSKEAREHNIPYTLVTLQMMGYAASSRSGRVSESEAAPSDRWVRVEHRKGGEFLSEPDKKDGVVYTDEFLNYLFEKLGKSDSETGIKAFALDNEPALWQYTHSLVQRKPLTCAELTERSADLAAAVKEADPNAEVFGPALFGYSAFDSFAGAPDWEQLKADNGYRWFIDYYLDQMRRSEELAGTRLLDVLDIHFYTEAKGICGERSCDHYDSDGCIRARIDSVRSLYDDTYREDSWITDSGGEFFPLLPNLRQSIEEYYPDTKLAFTEYDFGGGDHISGAVAQADMLGIFAEYGVYFSSLWAFENNEYQLAAINMFTNYDGAGSSFGDILTESSSSDRNAVSVYSAVGGKDDKLRIIAINKSIHDKTLVNISVEGDEKYSSAKVCGLYGDSAEIRSMDAVERIAGNSFAYELPPLSITEFEIRPKKNGAKTAALCAAAAVIIAAGAAAVKLKKKR